MYVLYIIRPKFEDDDFPSLGAASKPVAKPTASWARLASTSKTATATPTSASTSTSASSTTSTSASSTSLTPIIGSHAATPHGTTLELFGSLSCDLSLKHSDIDLAVNHHGGETHVMLCVCVRVRVRVHVHVNSCHRTPVRACACACACA